MFLKNFIRHSPPNEIELPYFDSNLEKKTTVKSNLFTVETNTTL